MNILVLPKIFFFFRSNMWLEIDEFQNASRTENTFRSIGPYSMLQIESLTIPFNLLIIVVPDHII